MYLKKWLFMNKKFGPFIREIRIQKGLGQRELASKIGVSASYLNDIEKDKRTAPKLDIIKKISKILSIDNKKLNDLAGISKKTLAPDINDFIAKNPKINSLIRTIQENDLNEKQIESISTIASINFLFPVSAKAEDLVEVYENADITDLYGNKDSYLEDGDD